MHFNHIVFVKGNPLWFWESSVSFFGYSLNSSPALIQTSPQQWHLGQPSMHVYAQICMHSEVPRFELNFFQKGKLKKMYQMAFYLQAIYLQFLLRLYWKGPYQVSQLTAHNLPGAWLIDIWGSLLHHYFEHLLHLMKMMILQQLKNFESYLFHYLWMLKFIRKLSCNRESS